MKDDIFLQLARKKRGSLWGKWDLHFHTPSSYDYQNKSTSDEHIIEILRANNIRLVVVTDHNTIDVQRIKHLQELAKGDITILPGIELCAGGGTPIHFIGIFDDSADIDYIWSQLNVKSSIASQQAEGRKINQIYCDLKETSKLIKNLGGIVSIHSGSKSNSIEIITNSLPYAEAQKSDIIEYIDIFELGKQVDREGYLKNVIPFVRNLRFRANMPDMAMIMGSDNHSIDNYQWKTHSWFKGNPTFAGLKQVLLEPYNRIYIGDVPPLIDRLNRNKLNYIDALTISPIENYDKSNGVWFEDNIIPFSPELTVVIGNKGSGKSAISDTLGLMGDSDNSKHFSFLKPKKFLTRGFGENFQAKLEWFAEEKNTSKLLNDEISSNSLPSIKYLPQSYFENICNDLDDSNFENELQSVIFKHLKDEEKLEAKTFSELVAFRTKAIEENLKAKQEELNAKNIEIINVERKLHPDFREKLETQLNVIKKSIAAHNNVKPKEVANPSNGNLTEKENHIQKQIDDIQLKVSSIEDEISIKKKRKADINYKLIKLDDLSTSINNIQNNITDLLNENESLIKELNIDNPSELIRIEYNKEILETHKRTLKSELLAINLLLCDENDEFLNRYLNAKPTAKKEEILSKSIVKQLSNYKEQRLKLTEELSAPYKRYEKFKEDLKQWEKVLLELSGTEESPKDGTKVSLEQQLKYITDKALPELDILRRERNNISEEIFNIKQGVILVFDELKESIAKIISSNEQLLSHYNIEVIANFKYIPNFLQFTSDSIQKNVWGYFYRDGDLKKVKEIFDEIDLSKFSNIIEAYNSFFCKLEQKDGDKPNHIHDQLKDPLSFYNYLYGFENLDERYELTLNSKSLEMLSPGERGALLLVFYLMIDDDVCPLVIDQPEDNLDNKSVYEILVHFIRESKKKRQIILVTHNPNLAVGADAENIIYVAIDKSNKNTFNFLNGGIEDMDVNQLLVDVLEGTMPAFNLRRLKYIYNKPKSNEELKEDENLLKTK